MVYKPHCVYKQNCVHKPSSAHKPNGVYNQVVRTNQVVWGLSRWSCGLPFSTPLLFRWSQSKMIIMLSFLVYSLPTLDEIALPFNLLIKQYNWRDSHVASNSISRNCLDRMLSCLLIESDRVTFWFFSQRSTLCVLPLLLSFPQRFSYVLVYSSALFRVPNSSEKSS